jgi:hypothetical protein
VTARAVPFLVELCSSDDTPDRHRILALLRALLTVLPENHREGFTADVDEPPGTSLEDAAAAVRAGAEVFVACVEAPEPRLRSSAAALLPLASPSAAAASALRRAYAKEPSAASRASELLGLGLTGRRLGSSEDQELLEAALADDEACVRVAAAIALVFCCRQASPATIEVLSSGASLSDVPDEDLPWRGGRLGELAAMAVAELGIHDRPRAAAILTDMLEARVASTPAPPPWTPSPAEEMLARLTGTAPVPQPVEAPAAVLEIARELLHTALRPFDGREDDEVVPDELDPTARAGLRLLMVDHHLSLDYRRYGLPRREEGLRYLGLSAPGPLDRPVQGRPAWRWLRELGRGEVTEDDVVAAFIDALDAKGLIGLVRDVLCGAYAWPAEEVLVASHHATVLGRLLVEVEARLAAR